jgi:hypothetical protein
MRPGGIGAQARGADPTLTRCGVFATLLQSFAIFENSGNNGRVPDKVPTNRAAARRPT